MNITDDRGSRHRQLILYSILHTFLQAPNYRRYTEKRQLAEILPPYGFSPIHHPRGLLSSNQRHQLRHRGTGLSCLGGLCGRSRRRREAPSRSSEDGSPVGYVFPNDGLFIYSPLYLGTKSCPCGQDEIPLRGSKSTLRVVEICRLSLQTEKPAELSFCGLCLPWQLSTLAGPVVRLPSTC